MIGITSTYHVHTSISVDVVASLEAPNLVPPKRLPRPFLSKCGRDRSYLSRPQTCGREKHTFLRRGIPRPPISGREKPNIVVVKDLISSSVIFLNAILRSTGCSPLI